MYRTWLLGSLVGVFLFTGTVDDAQARGKGDKIEQGEVFRCDSVGRAPTFCRAETRGGVILISQDSRKSCIQGRTWGQRRDGIWVKDGCRGTFRATLGNSNSSRTMGYRGNPNMPTGTSYAGGELVDTGDYAVRCKSVDGKYNYCPASNIVAVELVEQFSDRRCTYKKSWGYDDGGVWVDNGCHAEFSIR